MTGIVPIVDVSSWNGNPADRQRVARQVDDACSEVGFFQMMGHGLPVPMISQMLDAVDQFFALPVEEKSEYRSPSAEVNRGYASRGSEVLAYSLGRAAPPDLFEAFNIGPDQVPDEPVYAAERHRIFAPNIWPTRPTGLRPALTTYFGEVTALAHRLSGIFARALGLDESFFVDKTDHSTDTMRVNYYWRPLGSPDPLPGQLRMSEHTDYGILTVLYADAVPGLQIVGPDRAWHDVVPEPGALLVNLGDLLAQWTNDRWRSTVHRVVPPPSREDGPARRRSVAFFHDGNYDAVVECLPTCTGTDNPPKYASVVAGDHLMAKLLGPRTQQPSDATSTLGDRLPD
jgi:isopenicillin N synthase-like dioxygenase